MNKVELWRKGDRLTATKLNDALKVVNDLVEAENNRIEKAATTQGSLFNVINNADNVPSWIQDITPLWDLDGETVLYDGWDGLGDLTKDNGLYGRYVGFTALSETNYKADDALCLLKEEAAISAGQQVIQEITIDSKGKISDNQVKIYDNLNSIPKSVINPQGETKLYRRLSRIICDPTAPSGESVNPSLAQKYKSIATNDFTLSPITVSAVPADSDAIPLSYQQGAFTKIKGIENRGGLKFHTGNNDILGLEVVGGSGSVSLCSGCGITVSKDNDKYVIKRNLYVVAAESHNSTLNPDNNNALKIEQSNINGKITYYLYAPKYKFDCSYFCVSGDYVTLNLDAIRTAINSPACC